MKRVLRRLGMGLMALIFLIFTGFGMVMVVTGDGQDRILGLICVLLFGLGGVAYFMSKVKRGDLALRVETLTWEGAPVRALVVPMRKARWVTTMVAVLGMGIALVLMGVNATAFKDPGESALFIQVVGYGGGAFFLLVGLGHLLGIRKGPPRLALLESGIDLTGAAEAFVPWDVIAEVGRYDLVVRGSTQRFAGVRVADRAAIRKPAFTRVLMTGGRAMSGWDLTYAEAMFDLTADQLAELISAFHQRPELRRVPASLPEGDLDFDHFAATHLRDSSGQVAAPLNAPAD